MTLDPTLGPRLTDLWLPLPEGPRPGEASGPGPWTQLPALKRTVLVPVLSNKSCSRQGLEGPSVTLPSQTPKPKTTQNAEASPSCGFLAGLARSPLM